MNRDKARKIIIGRVRVSENGCWEWKKSIRPNGYARLTVERKSWYAHRLSFYGFNGEIKDGLDVCHKCDNRKCVNPEHLFLGSRAVNMQDAVKKGRQASGEKLPQTKISDADRLVVIELIKSGKKYKDIAESYGVTRSAINHIAIINGIRRNKCKKV